MRTLPASGGAVEYVPTAEDEAEANAAKERELARKRQDLRNDHPFLSMTKKDRQDEMEDRYDAALSKVFEPERIRLEEAARREAEAERKRVEEEARMLAEVKREREEMLRNETEAQREKRLKREEAKEKEMDEIQRRVHEEIEDEEHEQEAGGGVVSNMFDFRAGENKARAKQARKAAAKAEADKKTGGST